MFAAVPALVPAKPSPLCRGFSKILHKYYLSSALGLGDTGTGDHEETWRLGPTLALCPVIDAKKHFELGKTVFSCCLYGTPPILKGCVISPSKMIAQTKKQYFVRVFENFSRWLSTVVTNSGVSRPNAKIWDFWLFVPQVIGVPWEMKTQNAKKCNIMP